MERAIAVLNAGSSSLKFSIFLDRDRELQPLFRGQLDGLFTAPRFVVRDQAGETIDETSWPQGTRLGHEGATGHLFEWAEEQRKRLGGQRLTAVGHRVGHGGLKYLEPVRIDAGVLAELERLIPLVPLHQPYNLAPIKALRERRPEMPQVACFDTAFHRTQPEVAQAFALPRAYTEKGIRRYGFHGISYEYIASELPKYDARAAGGRVVVAHLGNGSSLCALRNGRSVATTMGFSSLDGLPMGTRCGSLDPGVILLLLDHLHMDARAIEAMLYKESGLLGVSGISSDMRTLLASDGPTGGRGRRSLCLPHRPRAGLAGRGARRARCAGVHCRDRRELRRDPGTGLPRCGMARRRAGRGGQRDRGTAHQPKRKPGCGVGHPDERGTHDRSSY